MRIYVTTIPEEGLDIEEELNPKKLDIESDSVHYDHAIKVKAHVEKEKNIITADCSIKGDFFYDCARCLEQFKVPINKKEIFIYKTDGENFLDLDHNIRETIILDYPLRMLCKEDCKGLCYSCGKNLNEGPCGCKKI